MIKKIQVLCLLTGLCIGSGLWAQSATDIARIAASQAEASPLYFGISEEPVRLQPQHFSDSRECIVRNGMPHVLNLLKAGKPVQIAYIGGSITQAEKGYRMQSAAYIAARYPKAAIRFLNAGVSGTGTDLGACRIGEQLLNARPDLIFIEFAVNGAYAPGMEGMIRQIREISPHTDICLLYTIMTGQTEDYAAGRIPANIRGLEAVADHYGVPSVHLGLRPSLLEKDNQLLWKGTAAAAGSRILFSSDGIHPLAEGGDLYAEAIARAFLKMEQHKSLGQKTVKLPLLADNWEDAGMYDPLKIARFGNHWERLVPEKGETFYRYKPWFPYIMKASVPGASFSFSFEGTAFGVFDIGGPEAGQLEVVLDGRPVKFTKSGIRGVQLRLADTEGAESLINRFNAFCNNRYRGQYDLVQVPPGKHTVTIKLSATKADKQKILGKNTEDILANPSKYDQTVFYLGRILVKGKPILPSGPGN